MDGLECNIFAIQCHAWRMECNGMGWNTGMECNVMVLNGTYYVMKWNERQCTRVTTMHTGTSDNTPSADFGPSTYE
eukprot:scaffold431533_cov45-Prasinocladus_malaysianus.AAC.1